MCPHTYYYILQYTCPHTTRHVPEHVYMCPHAAAYAPCLMPYALCRMPYALCRYIRVLMLLHMRPDTTRCYMRSYDYILHTLILHTTYYIRSYAHTLIRLDTRYAHTTRY
jgi:hypothetical protein